MRNLRVLNDETIRELLDFRSVLSLVEYAYSLKNSNQGFIFPVITYDFEPGKADMDIKSGYLKGDINVFGLKLVSWFGNNIKKNLPALNGTIMIFDSETGLPLSILSATYITCLRTGAAGGVGIKHLARKDSENLLLIGAGHQALYQLAGALTVLDNIRKVAVYDPIDYQSSLNFCSSARSRLLSLLSENSKVTEGNAMTDKFNIQFEAVRDIQTAVGQADIIVTVTPSRKPLIKKEWVKKGTHLNCIGSDMEGKQEIDERIFSMARVFVDDLNQAVNVGETEIPIKKGIIRKEDIIGEIGNVILGKLPGRISDDDITIFDSTGIALQDLVTAKHVFDLAEERKLGTLVSY